MKRYDADILYSFKEVCIKAIDHLQNGVLWHDPSVVSKLGPLISMVVNLGVFNTWYFAWNISISVKNNMHTRDF